MKTDFSVFPTLKTNRFVLRKLSLADAPEIFELRADAKAAVLTGREPANHIDEAVQFIQKIENLIHKNESMYWCIGSEESAKLAGAICLWNFDLPNHTVEVGYELLPQYRGQGIMAEVIRRIVEYAFDKMDVETVVAFPSADNPSSVKVLENTGFRLADGAYKNTHENVAGMLTYIITRT